MKKEEKCGKEVKVIDFSNVSVEMEIDKNVNLNISKNVGNTIHLYAEDIGLDDVARKIYHEGKAEIPVEYLDVIRGIVKRSNFLAPVKIAIDKLLTI